MKVTLLALTLNEIEGVKVILPQIDPSRVDQILVIDGDQPTAPSSGLKITATTSTFKEAA